MDIKELEEQLEILNDEFQENKNKLFKEFCFSNNPYKVGDVFEDSIGKILIERIMYSRYRFSGDTPCCSYYGPELKKDGTPRKDGSKRQVWQSNDIKKKNNMSNQIKISNLTPEQIEDLKQQLKAYDNQPKSIMDRVKTWEDAIKIPIIEKGYFINAHSYIVSTEESPSRSQNKNILPSEKHAKSILAACQLMVIAEALNEGSIENRYWVLFYFGKFTYSENDSDCKSGVIRFKDKATAQYAITQFEDLWYDYFMIDKPE